MENQKITWKQLLRESGLRFKDRVYEEAAELARKALASAEREFGQEDASFATVQVVLGRIYAVQKKCDEMDAFCRKSFVLRQKLVGNEGVSIASLCGSWAKLYRAKGDYVKAEELLERSLLL